MNTLKNVLFILFILFILSIGIIVGIDNNSPQHLTLMQWKSADLPLYQWLLLFFGVGFILGMVAMLRPMIRLQFQRGKLQRELNKLKANAPLSDKMVLPSKSDVRKSE